MSDIRIEPLAGISMSTLTRAWNDAFSDYSVSLPMTDRRLQSFMNQNGVELAKSVGAFSGDQLIGFWLNGIRTVRGVLTAYDSGTAICPGFRGKGISTQMAKESSTLLKQCEARDYTLEVISDNTRARHVYTKDGFKVSRELISFKFKTPQDSLFPKDDTGIDYLETEMDAKFWNSIPPMEYEASWQNSVLAVQAIDEEMRAITAMKDGGVVGFGILQTTRGRIPRIGVAKEYWETAVPNNLLARLLEIMDAESEVRIINVDINAPRTIAFLEGFGFEEMLRSLEMKRSLS